MPCPVSQAEPQATLRQLRETKLTSKMGLLTYENWTSAQTGAKFHFVEVTLMKSKLLAALTVVAAYGPIILLLGTTSLAVAAPSAESRAACAEDRNRLCRSFIGNPLAVEKCMIANRNLISQKCRSARITYLSRHNPQSLDVCNVVMQQSMGTESHHSPSFAPEYVFCGNPP
jgi:hypothetical protein